MRVKALLRKALSFFVAAALFTNSFSSVTMVEAHSESETSYPRAWAAPPQEDIPSSAGLKQKAPVPIFSQQVAAQEQPPEEAAVKLKVTAEPAIYLPGKPINLAWNIVGYDQVKAAADAQVVIRVPEGVAPSDQALAKAVTAERQLTLDARAAENQVEWTAEAEASPPFAFGIVLTAGGKEISEEVVVVDAAPYEAPKGKDTKIEGMGGKVRLEIPAAALEENAAFDVRYPASNTQPPVSLTWEPVEIIAAGKDSGKNITHFKEPITVQFHYDEKDLFDWNESDLMIFYYNDEQADWYPLATTVDTTNNLLSAKSDHLTVFDYKAASWQANSVPTVDAFKVSDFTGAATYEIDFWSPPGAAGFKPNLKLTYNSQVIDESSAFTQSSWVGMGWSLDTGAILRNMHMTNDNQADDTFSIYAGGVSGLLLPIGVDGNVTTYNTADQSFMKVQYNSGTDTWTAWGKDGTVYVFNQLARTNTTSGCSVSLDITWRWSLGSATDLNGNTITYTYSNETKPGCSNVIAVYPDTVLYPHGKYRARFVREARTDYLTSWTDGLARVLYGTQRLSELVIEHDPTGTANWQAVRRYDFTYASDNATSNVIYPRFKWRSVGHTLTLLGVQELSGDGYSALPATQFTYEDSMHLTQVDNGQGGQVSASYDRWYFFDDSNKELRSLVTWFGDAGYECSAGYPLVWVKATTPSIVQCNIDDYLQIGDTGYFSIAHRSLPENVVKPGARYMFHIRVGPLVTQTDANWGFIDTSNNENEMLYSDNYTQPAGTISYDRDLEDSLEMPVSYDPTSTKLRIECDACVIMRLQFSLYGTYYRVTSRTITDQATGNTTTYTHRYDNAAPNAWGNSEAIVEADGDLSKLYTYAGAEFRGHSMSAVLNEDDLETINWYYQSDGLKGRLYHSVALEESFYNDMGAIDANYWSQSVAGTFETVGIAQVDFDLATRATNPDANWNVSLERNSYALADGMAAIGHFRLSGANAQGEVGLVGQSGKFFGIEVAPENGQPVARLRYDTGAGQQDGDVLIGAGDFELDKWYVFLLFVDSTNGFRVRIWQLDQPETQGETTLSGFGAESWKFRQRVNSGAIWLDTYFEGTIYSENETHYATSTQYAHGSLVGGGLTNFLDLNVIWAYPTESISRTYEGDASWYGTRQVYQYETSDQNGSQYGNQTRVTYSEWNGSAWVDHHATRTEYWPNDDGSHYLVNLLARATAVDCNPTCSFESDPLSEALYIYDGNSTYNAQPTVGRVSKQRTFVDVVQEASRYAEVGYGYDAYGNVQSVTTYSEYAAADSSPGSGSQTLTREYDTTYHTYLLSETNALSQTTTTTYDYDLGLPDSVTDANNNSTSAEYDVFGRMVAVRAPGDESGTPSLAIAYTDYTSGDPYHLTLTQKLDSSRTTQSLRYYSGLGKLIQSQLIGAELDSGTANVVVDAQYDGLNRQVKQTKPYSYSGSPVFQAQTFTQPATTTVYDLLSRVTSVSEPNGNQATTAYQDLQTIQTDPRQQSSTTHYDVWGQVTSVTPPAGPGLAYQYDKLGRLTQVTKGSGGAATQTTISYDAAGRKVGMVDPDMGSWSYGYDAAGNLSTQTDGRSCVTSLAYDALNRLTGKSYSGSGACDSTPDVTYSYDGASFSFLGGNYGGGSNTIGQRTGMVDGSGATVWSYDSRGRQTTETKHIYSNAEKTLAESFTTAWSYNSADLVESMTYPDGEVVTLGYNAQGAQTSLTNETTSFTYVKNVTYDEAGRITGVGLGDDSGVAVISRTQDYFDWSQSEDGGLLSEMAATNIASATLQQLDYDYDPNGNILAIGDSLIGEDSAFTYDALNRLTAMTVTDAQSAVVHSELFGYNADTGNLAEKGPDAYSLATYTYAVEHPHAATALGANTYAYDANGNQVERHLDNMDQVLTYDAENRLIQVITDRQSASDVIFADGFESGDFSAWSEYTPSGVSVTAASAAVGSYGLEVTADGTNLAAVKYHAAAAEKRYRARFYFDPNTFSLPDEDRVAIFRASSSTSAALHVYLYYESGGYWLSAEASKDDTTKSATALRYITDDWTAIELDWQAASAPEANDGYLTLWINDTQIETLSGLDNDAQEIQDVWLGIIDSADEGMSGTFYYDAYQAQRTQAIGLDPNGPSVSAPPTPPDVIFADGFESGDFSAWSEYASNDISVSAAAAAVGSYGMTVTANGTNEAAVKYHAATAEKRYRARFYFDPDAFSLPDEDRVAIFRASSSISNAMRVFLHYESGGYWLSAEISDDSSNKQDTTLRYIIDDWTAIELDWQAASAPEANDGYLTLWINDTQIETISGVDNDTLEVQDVWLGIIGSIDEGMSGTFYYDAYQAQRTQAIGLDPNGPSVSAPPEPPVVDEIFADGFESGDFSAWSEYSPSDVSVTAAATAVGSYGLAVTANGTNYRSVKYNAEEGEKRYRARFYFDPNAFSLPVGDKVAIFQGSSLTDTAVRIFLHYSAVGYWISAEASDNNSQKYYTEQRYIIDDWTALEIDWQAASAPQASDGYLTLWINNTEIETISGIDNDTQDVQGVWLGIIGSADAGMSGTLYYDAFQSQRTQAIGLDPNGPSVSPPPAPPDLLFADGFESGDFSAWTAATTDGGDLAVAGAAAYQGSYGLQAVIDDQNAIYLKAQNAGDESHYRARFYFHPNSLSMSAGDDFSLMEGFSIAGNNRIMRLSLRYNDSQYQLRAQLKDDGSSYTSTNDYTISNAWHCVEIEWKAATGEGANNGELSLWIDDTLQQTVSGVDNDTRRFGYTLLGAVANLDSGTGGTIYFDEFEARRDNYIGLLAYVGGYKLAKMMPVGWQRPVQQEEQESAEYVYDGDGVLVKSIVNEVVTYYASTSYQQQVDGEVETVVKYYRLGSQQVAVRRVSGEVDTLHWLLGDHLGSATVAANADGSFYSEQRYTAFGEIRYSSGETPTGYQYTGQLSQEEEIGLYWYVARWYDSDLSQWANPNPIIQGPYNPLDWDHYQYTRSNPIKYNDPSGYDVDCGIGESLLPNGLECKKQVEIEKRIEYLNNEKEKCATNPNGANCPDYVELAALTVTVMAGPEILSGAFNFLEGMSWEVGAWCMGSQACKTVLFAILGIEEQQTVQKPTSNQIGAWGAEQVGQQLPVQVQQFRVLDQAIGKLRVYDGRSILLPDTYVEIKTSMKGVVYATRFIRNQVALDANQATKPLWIFVNAVPSGPLMDLLRQAGVTWSQLRVPWP